MRYVIVAMCLFGVWAFASKFIPSLLVTSLPVLLVGAAVITVCVGNKVK